MVRDGDILQCHRLCLFGPLQSIVRTGLDVEADGGEGGREVRGDGGIYQAINTAGSVSDGTYQLRHQV